MRPDGNGKGDKPRPLGVPMEVFDRNFDAIFGKKKKDETEKCNFKCDDVGCGSNACTHTDCGK